MIELTTDAKAFGGGWGTITADGTPAASVTVQFRPKGATNWHTLQDDAGEDVTFAAAGYVNFRVAGPAELRTSVASSVPIVLGLGFDATRPYEH